MGTVTTVTGDIPASRIGFCQPHEHVYINATIALRDHPELRLTDFRKSLDELKMARVAGCDSLVDAQPGGAGRDAVVLRDASRLSGVNIIASTGYHLPFFYPDDHWINIEAEDSLASHFASEITDGMFLGGGFAQPDIRTSIRAGVIKAALFDASVSGRNAALLRSAGHAAVATGAPILLHTDKGLGALEALKLLDDLGLPPHRVMVCHVDRQATDYGIHNAVAESGAYLEYDTITLFEHHDNAEEVLLIDHMIQRGYLEQLLLSTDPTADRLKSHGSPVGMDYLLTSFLPLLRAFGIPDTAIDCMCRANPAHALERIPTR